RSEEDPSAYDNTHWFLQTYPERTVPDQQRSRHEGSPEYPRPARDTALHHHVTCTVPEYRDCTFQVYRISGCHLHMPNTRQMPVHCPLFHCYEPNLYA